jgi:hypothetical protein
MPGARRTARLLLLVRSPGCVTAGTSWQRVRGNSAAAAARAVRSRAKAVGQAATPERRDSPRLWPAHGGEPSPVQLPYPRRDLKRRGSIMGAHRRADGRVEQRDHLFAARPARAGSARQGRSPARAGQSRAVPPQCEALDLVRLNSAIERVQTNEFGICPGRVTRRGRCPGRRKGWLCRLAWRGQRSRSAVAGSARRGRTPGDGWLVIVGLRDRWRRPSVIAG